MPETKNEPGCREGETAWEWLTAGSVVYQRDCDAPDCDHGLVPHPGGFCPRCGGSGYLLRHPDPVSS